MSVASDANLSVASDRTGSDKADSVNSSNEKLTDSELERALKAVASARRLLVLEWLKEPESHFPPQVHGDQATQGVCTQFIAAKLEVSQPAASRHMKLLAQAELVKATSLKGWTYYRRNEQALNRFKQHLFNEL